MNYSRRFLEELFDQMEPGQSIIVAAEVFAEAFPPTPWWLPSPCSYEKPEDAFLSSRIGSAWGSWRVEKIVWGTRFGDYRVSRHKESKDMSRRYYVDPDRRWMFRQGPDGLWTQVCRPDGSKVDDEQTPENKFISTPTTQNRRESGKVGETSNKVGDR